MLGRGLSRSISMCTGVILRSRNVSWIRNTAARTSFVKRNIHCAPSLLKTYFASSHEWVNVSDDGSTALIGITDHAQDQLGDIVYCELPAVDAEIEKGGNLGLVESVKAASDLYSPVSGVVLEVNTKLDDAPQTINEDPMGEGWIAKMKLGNVEELEELMGEDQYKKFLEE